MPDNSFDVFAFEPFAENVEYSDFYQTILGVDERVALRF